MTDFHEIMIPQGSDGDKPTGGNSPAGATIDRGLGHPASENDYYQFMVDYFPVGLAGHLIIR